MEPSFFLIINLILLSINLNVCFANSNPAIIACWLEINLTFIILSFLTKFEVISQKGIDLHLKQLYTFLI